MGELDDRLVKGVAGAAEEGVQVETVTDEVDEAGGHRVVDVGL